MAPKLFNSTLDDVAQAFDREARKRRWGWPISTASGTKYICLICFADNYWLITTSPAELQKANACWQGLLEAAGWHTPVSDMCYATTAEDDGYINLKIHYKGEEVKRMPRAEGFKALGTQITFVTRHDAELARRIKAGWASFHKNRDVLCCKAAPLKRRLKFLEKL